MLFALAVVCSALVICLGILTRELHRLERACGQLRDRLARLEGRVPFGD